MKRLALTMFVAAGALLAQNSGASQETIPVKPPSTGTPNGTTGATAKEDANGNVKVKNGTVAPGNSAESPARKRGKRGKNNADTSGSASTRENEHSNASTPH